MLQILTKIFITCLLLINVVSCKSNFYSKKEFLNDFSNKFHITNLKDFGFRVENVDLNEPLNLFYLLEVLTIYSVIPEKVSDSDYLNKSLELGIVDDISKDKYVNKEDADTYISRIDKIKENNFLKVKNNIILKNKNILKNKDINNYCAENKIKYDDIFQNIDFYYDKNIDFKNAEIIELLEFESLVKKDELLEKISNNLFSKTTKIGNYEIAYSVNADKLSLSILNNRKFGSFYFESDIYDIKPQIRLKNDDYTYFKLNFKTSSKAGYKKDYSVYKNFDFKKEISSDLILKIQKLYSQNYDILAQSIPLLNIKTPIDAFSQTYLVLTLNVNFYVSGRVEFTFSTNNTIGFERKGDAVRFINENSNDFYNLIKASAGATISFNAGISTMNINIADIEVETGLSFDLNSYVFYKEKQYSLDFPEDIVENINNPHLNLCTNIKTNRVLKLKTNTKRTILSKFKLSYEIDLSKNLTNKMFKNFQEVTNCSYENNNIQENKINKVDSGRIILNYYHKAIEINEVFKISIRELPDNYNFNDLVFESENPNYVTVDENGMVEGKEKGVSIIKIKTKDDKYTISLTVLVKSYVGNN